MTRYTTEKSYRSFFSAAGLEVAPDRFGYCALLANTTYYVGLGAHGNDSPQETVNLSAHIQGSTIGAIATITYEQSNMARRTGVGGDKGSDDVIGESAVVGDFVPQALSASDTDVVGTGWSVTGGGVAVAGTGIGAAFITKPASGAKRARAKLVTGGTGGNFRVGINAKLGA